MLCTQARSGQLRSAQPIQFGQGLNRQQAGQWVASAPELIATNGGILARGASHTAFFSNSVQSIAPVEIKMPDGQWLKMRFYGLAYHSDETNVLIGQVKDSFPQIVGSNEVVYADALEADGGLIADVKYTYSCSGIEQDIIMRRRPPAPENYSMSRNSAQLLALSEIVDGPEPTVRQVSYALATNSVVDSTLNFGTMRMLPGGRAFTLRSDRKRHGVPVWKTYETLDGRRFVIERLRYSQINSELLKLPAGTGAVTNGSVDKASRWFADGKIPSAVWPKESRLIASNEKRSVRDPLAREEPGVTIDWYITVDDGSSVTFSCYYTYLVQGECHLTSAVFDPKTVVKHDMGAALFIDGSTVINTYDNCGGDTNTDRVTLTSVNDNQHGDTIDFLSTGNPQFGDYGPGLLVQSGDLPTAQALMVDLYGSPGIVSSLSVVSVQASDPVALKGADAGTFTISRADGDWTQPLVVPFVISGSAVPGSDYESIGTTVTIPANAASVNVTVTPLSSNHIVYESTVILTIQPNSGYGLGSPSAATIRIDDPDCPTPPPLMWPSNLVAWWRGEGDATDSAGNNNGVLLNGLGFDTGYVGQGFKFDGIDDRLTVSNSSVLNFGANADYSIECWVKPDPGNADFGVQSIVDKRYAPDDSTATGYTLHLVYGRLGCQVASAGYPVNFGPAGPDLQDGAFHHVAVTVQRGSTNGGHLYVDGSSVLTFPTDQSGDLSNTEPLRIGNHATSYRNCFFTGVIDEVSLYARSLRVRA